MELSCVGGVMTFRSGGFWSVFGAIAASLLFLLQPIPSRGQGAAEPTEDAPWRLTWIGAQTAGKDWSVYTGTTYALTGLIDRAGWRLRIVGGYGRYGYLSDGDWFQGQYAFNDALIGYQMQFADVIVKGFAGLATAGHSVAPFDPENEAIGYNYGAVGALESWIDLSDRMWLSAAGKYSTVFNSFGANIRLGYRWWGPVSAGLESGASGNADHASGLAALFVHHTWTSGDVRLSVGAAADRDMDVAPYAAVSLSLKY